MSVWLVVRDSELRALFLRIGEEAGVPLAPMDPDTAARLLRGSERPQAMLISRSLIPSPLHPTRLSGIRRLAVASGDLDPGADGIPVSHLLKLPATLEDVEGTLRWLAWDGDQVGVTSSRDASSRLA
jgi:hypothetical protein